MQDLATKTSAMGPGTLAGHLEWRFSDFCSVCRRKFACDFWKTKKYKLKPYETAMLTAEKGNGKIFKSG